MNIDELWKQAGGSFVQINQHSWPEARIVNPQAFVNTIVNNVISRLEDLYNQDDRLSIQEIVNFLKEYKE